MAQVVSCTRKPGNITFIWIYTPSMLPIVMKTYGQWGGKWDEGKFYSRVRAEVLIRWLKNKLKSAQLRADASTIPSDKNLAAGHDVFRGNWQVTKSQVRLKVIHCYSKYSATELYTATETGSTSPMGAIWQVMLWAPLKKFMGSTRMVKGTTNEYCSQSLLMRPELSTVLSPTPLI